MHFIKAKKHLGLSAGYCGKKKEKDTRLNLRSTDDQAKFK